MDILKQSFAPITKEAWEEIYDEAKNTLSATLSARKFVDVEGPKGLDTAAVSIGKLQIPAKQSKDNVQYGIHQLLPLVETRMPFSLNIWELDNLARGSKDVDLDNVHQAAKKIAKFEENAIYKGFKASGIEGLLNSSEYSNYKLNTAADNLLEVISKAIINFNNKAVEGPYTLVVGEDIYKKINANGKSYPLRKRLNDLIEGKIIFSENISGALLVSERGGDFILTLGQDYSIGYESHDKTNVYLYLMASFTFQIIDPAAIAVIK